MSELIDRLTGKEPCNGSELQEAADRIAELENDIQVMVEKAAAKHRPAYEEQQRRIAELEQDVAFLQSCVNSGETAKPSDRPSQRTPNP